MKASEKPELILGVKAGTIGLSNNSVSYYHYSGKIFLFATDFCFKFSDFITAYAGGEFGWASVLPRLSHAEYYDYYYLYYRSTELSAGLKFEKIGYHRLKINLNMGTATHKILWQKHFKSKLYDYPLADRVMNQWYSLQCGCTAGYVFGSNIIGIQCRFSPLALIQLSGNSCCLWNTSKSLRLFFKHYWKKMAVEISYEKNQQGGFFQSDTQGVGIRLIGNL